MSRSVPSHAPGRSIAGAQDDPAPVRIVLSGYYGYNNLGDEAILTALVQQFRHLAPNTQLVALSADPATTSARLGIEAVPRLNLPAIARALRSADLFVSGGGSLLQDVTGLGSVPYYLGLVKMAQMLHVRTMFLGQGVGPLNWPTSRFLVGRVARKADALTVRDPASRELLARCGVPIERITLTADPVLALESAPAERIDAIWQQIGLDPAAPTIAVSVRPWSAWFERQLKAFSAVLAQLAAQWGAQILLLPFHRPDDELLIEELRYCLDTRPGEHRPHVVTLPLALEPAEMLGLLARCDMLIGMRLHALIMAACGALPAIGLVYDPKITAFAERAGFPTIASVTALEDSDALTRLLERVWGERQAMRTALETQRNRWAAEARLNAEIALSVARGSYARGA